MKRMFIVVLLMTAFGAGAMALPPTSQPDSPSARIQDMQERIADVESVNAALRRQIAALQLQVKTLQDQAKISQTTAPTSQSNPIKPFDPQAKPEIGESESQLKASGVVNLRNETANSKLYTVGNKSGLFGVVVADGKVSRVETLSDSPFGTGSSPAVNRQLLLELGRQ